MPNEYASGVPLPTTDGQFSGSLFFRHQGHLSTFDVLCIPPTPEVPGNTLYWDTMPQDEKLLTHIGKALALLGATRAYIPHCYGMTGRIGSACELLDEVISTPACIPVYQSRCNDAHMDGLTLDPGEAAVFAVGGCGIAIGGKTVAHCGRDSLIDRASLEGMSPSRSNFSVVDAIARVARQCGFSVRKERFSFLFALPASCYAHPLEDEKYGDYNERMFAYAKSLHPDAAYVEDDILYLGIGPLASAQAHGCGFAVARHDCELPTEGEFAHTRHPDPAMREKRNITVVVRRD